MRATDVSFHKSWYSFFNHAEKLGTPLLHTQAQNRLLGQTEKGLCFVKPNRPCFETPTGNYFWLRVGYFLAQLRAWQVVSSIAISREEHGNSTRSMQTRLSGFHASYFYSRQTTQLRRKTSAVPFFTSKMIKLSSNQLVPRIDRNRLWLNTRDQPSNTHAWPGRSTTFFWQLQLARRLKSGYQSYCSLLLNVTFSIRWSNTLLDSHLNLTLKRMQEREEQGPNIQMKIHNLEVFCFDCCPWKCSIQRGFKNSPIVPHKQFSWCSLPKQL